MAGHPQLEKILAALSHLNLEGDITDKQENPIRFGGMCDVFTARSIKQNKKVAVKRIRAHLAGNEAFAKVGTTIRQHCFKSFDTPRHQQFAKEIRVWVGLQHENVLPLLGFILGGPSLIPSLISEWMEQGILPDYTKKFPRASVHTCRMVRALLFNISEDLTLSSDVEQLLGIASGLSYLHAKGVIHADLKGVRTHVNMSLYNIDDFRYFPAKHSGISKTFSPTGRFWIVSHANPIASHCGNNTWNGGDREVDGEGTFHAVCQRGSF